MMARRAFLALTTMVICLVPDTGHAAVGPNHKGHRQHHQEALVFPGKPRLREDTYQGWGPWGRDGDSESNYLRNRVDPAVHARALSFRQFLGLDVPHGVAMTPMRRWSRHARKRAYWYKGTAVSLVGYIATVSQGPREQANREGSTGYDWHIRLGATSHASGAHTISTEAPPRVRGREHGFSMRTLKDYRRHGDRVRITGWLFLDNDHPIDLDRQRATLWEIHPVTRIEIWEKRDWVKIEG